MPLDSQYISIQEQFQSKNIDMDTLRLVLIGNKDLKYRLIGDPELVAKLVEDFILRVNQITNEKTYLCQEDLDPVLSELEHEVVVFKIFSSFLSEINSNNSNNIHESLQQFSQLVKPVVSFMACFIERLMSPTFTGSIYQSSTQKISTILEYMIDILIALFNNHSIPRTVFTCEFNSLFRFVVSLLLVSYESNGISKQLVANLLKLFPLLLNCGSKTAMSKELIITLLNVMLKYLSKEFQLILITSFPTTHLSPDAITRLAYEDSNLPSFKLDPHFLHAHCNLNLLEILMISIAQLFSILKNYDVQFPIKVAESKLGNDDNNTVDFPSNIYFFLLILLRSGDKKLSSISLNVIYFHLKVLKASLEKTEASIQETCNHIFANFAKLIPSLIDLLDIEDQANRKKLSMPLFLLSPSHILAELCAEYPQINESLQRANVDHKIMRCLEEQYKLNQKLKYFKVLKQNSQGNTVLVDFIVMMNKMQEKEVNNISDLFYLLSAWTINKEEYRERIVNYTPATLPKSGTGSSSNSFLPQLIFDFVDNHRFLLSQLRLLFKLMFPRDGRRLLKELDLPWFRRNLEAILTLLTDQSFSTVLHLIRSLSRSVALLRTFFVECNSIVSVLDADPNSDKTEQNKYTRDKMNLQGGFIHGLLKILKANERSSGMIRFLCKMNKMEDISSTLETSQWGIKCILLGILANFILDFSSFRYNIVNDNRLLKSLSEIYGNSKKMELNEGNSEIVLLHVIQLNVLRVLKNFLYNENQENKKELTFYFPIETFFKKITLEEAISSKTSGNEYVRKLHLEEKIVSFDILRNLTAGSPYFSSRLVQLYEKEFAAKNERHGVPKSWNDFVVNSLTKFDDFVRNGPVGKELFYNDSFMLNLMDNNDYVSLVLAINYIEDHKYTNIELISDDVMPKKPLLEIWKRFLDLTVSKDFEDQLDVNRKTNINNNLSSIKLSIVWIIINLSWKNDMLDVSLADDAVGSHDRADKSRGILDRLHSRESNIQNETIDMEVSEDDEDDSNTENEEEEDDDDPRVEKEMEKTGNGIHGSHGGGSEVETRRPKRVRLGRAHTDRSAPADRAKFLKDNGFLYILEKLIKNLSGYEKVHPRQQSYSTHRFDYFMSNDLLEKAKSAYAQLLDADAPETTTVASLARMHKPRFAKLPSTGEPSPLVRPDVNRGGEGFGYGSDQEYADAPSSEPQPLFTPHTPGRSRSPRNRRSSQNDGDEADPAESDAASNDNDDEMDYDSSDDYWVR